MFYLTCFRSKSPKGGRRSKDREQRPRTGEFRIGEAQPAVDVSHLIDDEDILSDETLPPPLPPQPIEADVQLAGK